MRSWFVYFCVILISLSAIPFAAAKAMNQSPAPKLAVFLDGEIVEIDAEEYVLRVLLAEGEICENDEALKSLAVAARSCALYFSLYGLKHDGFDACADKNCCVPLGNPEKAKIEFLARVKKAVEETRGEALTVNGFPALALFTHCAGSGTRQCEGFSYLSPTAESGKCEIHNLSLTLETDGILENISEKESCVVYDEGGKCVFSVFGNRVISGDDLADVLSLPSVEFSLEISEDGVTAVCNGVGHGYGLNLCAAQTKAEDGMKYNRILEIYFPKLNLNKIY